MTSPMPEFHAAVALEKPAPVYDLQLDGTKIGFYRDRVEAWKRGERIAPITVDGAWTRKCAASCNFCYAQLQASEDTVFTKKTAFEFLEDAAEVGVKGFSLISDGESTEVPYFAESVKYGADLGLQIGTSSNGVKLTRDVLEQILPSLSYLRFNFSGGDKHRWSQIMGLKQPLFDRVVANIKAAIEIKKRDNLPVNINLQFVVMPKDGDQILPFARLAKSLRPDYAIMKHCANSVDGDLDVDYRQYSDLFPLFEEAEMLSDDGFRVAVKWSRLQDEGKRDYNRCFGPPFIVQFSGSGTCAPCGQKFNSKYQKFHFGNLTRQRFRDIIKSDRYWEVMNYLASDQFDAQKDCGENCLQTLSNSWLDKLVQGKVDFPTSSPPPHLGFL
jgi:MoaA/NifB/PqqE/SkfB family radical SAM enzyme